MAGTFIGDQTSPTACPSRLSLMISSVSNGAGSGDEYDSWAATKCALESDFHVADDFDGSANNFNEESLNQAGNAVVRCASHSSTSARYLLRGDPGRDAGFVDGASQRVAGAGFAHAKNAAPGTSPSAEN